MKLKCPECGSEGEFTVGIKGSIKVSNKGLVYCAYDYDGFRVSENLVNDWPELAVSIECSKCLALQEKGIDEFINITDVKGKKI